MKYQFRPLLLIVVTVIFSACGSMFDIAGKGAKTSCLYLDTETMKIVQDCDARQIFHINVTEKTGKKDYKGTLILNKKFDNYVGEFALPFKKDSLNKKYLEITVQLTDTHFREMWYINTKPGDLAKKKKIASRYFGH